MTHDDEPKRATPEWAAFAKDGDVLATSIVPPVQSTLPGASVTQSGQPAAKAPNAEDYVEGILAGNRTLLARAITLVESRAPRHYDTARAVIQSVLPHSGKSLRLGISGVPGAGKSTFIEYFGTSLCERGRKVAVLAVDPSSSLTKGSILGDKTRMEKLSLHPNAFIRPSPSGGTLGGVAQRTREAALLCEAAGFDIIIIETVGVGQSEATVRSMVDCFLLLTVTGTGDELQAIKRGVMELADILIVNKADGANQLPAQRLAGELRRALHYLPPATPGWTTSVHPVSSTTGHGMHELWTTITRFKDAVSASGQFEARRQGQTKDWFFSLLKERALETLLDNKSVAGELPQLELEVTEGALDVGSAVDRVMACYRADRS